jgi:hypothetical protein
MARGARTALRRSFTEQEINMNNQMRLVVGSLLALLASYSFAQSSTETFTVNSPIKQLTKAIYDPAKHPNGIQSKEDLSQIVAQVNGASPTDVERTTIVHVLQWSNAEHTQVKSQWWYLQDPSFDRHHTSFYLESTTGKIQHTTISGQTHFRLVYIHLNSDLTSAAESFVDTNNGTGDSKLKVAVSYQITINKQDTQLMQDIKTLAQILAGGVNTQAATPELGYYSVFDFNSQFATSTLAISAALPNSASDNSDKETAATAAAANKKGSTPASGTAANKLATQTYTNEKPSYIGLSVAVPLNSYKDLSYDQSSSTFTPKTVNRQNVYVTVDAYLPASEPGLRAFRWVPHPFFGMPIKGQPLKNMMLGLGFGLKWVEPFAGVVFNEQQRLPTGATTPTNHWALKGAFGLKISVSSLKTALSSSSKSSAAK